MTKENALKGYNSAEHIERAGKFEKHVSQMCLLKKYLHEIIAEEL